MISVWQRLFGRGEGSDTGDPRGPSVHPSGSITVTESSEAFEHANARTPEAFTSAVTGAALSILII